MKKDIIKLNNITDKETLISVLELIVVKYNNLMFSKCKGNNPRNTDKLIRKYVKRYNNKINKILKQVDNDFISNFKSDYEGELQNVYVLMNRNICQCDSTLWHLHKYFHSHVKQPYGSQ